MSDVSPIIWLAVRVAFAEYRWLQPGMLHMCGRLSTGGHRSGLSLMNSCHHFPVESASWASRPGDRSYGVLVERVGRLGDGESCGSMVAMLQVAYVTIFVNTIVNLC